MSSSQATRGTPSPSKFSQGMSWLGSYCKEALRHPVHRMFKDNQSILGRLWQVSWIIALVVAGLCIAGAAKDLGTTDYIRNLFNECKVFEASCYISLGLFVTYVLWGKNSKLKDWLDIEESFRDGVLHGTTSDFTGLPDRQKDLL